MKIAPLMHEMRRHADLQPILVHTGQHYDAGMSEVFFEELEIPKPDIELGVGSASHAAQTAEIMRRFEPVLEKEKPDLVLVVGDVNSTIACALTAVKLGIPVAHVEAGLRSFDRSMPEEVNRVLTDAISHDLFVTERSAIHNLKREGILEERIHFVGNVMIDTLLLHREKAKNSPILKKLHLMKRTNSADERAIPYGVLTLHRPSNVDHRETLQGILQSLVTLSKELPIFFPCHPRTKRKIEEFGFNHLIHMEPRDQKDQPGVFLLEPLGYLDFLCLMSMARVVFTDSGGIQEETTILGIPCITLRENTERPVTLTQGTNVLVGTDQDKIISEALKALKGPRANGRIPELWDGFTAGRIVNILLDQPALVSNSSNRVTITKGDGKR